MRNRFSALKERFRSDPIYLNQIFLNADEGELADTMEATVSRFPSLLLGSYPDFWNKDYSLKLTLESREQEELSKALQFLQSRIPEECILRVE